MTDISQTNIDTGILKNSFAFHGSLNEKLWADNDLRLDVRVAMLRAAKAFYEFLDVPGLKVEDVIFTGSNAAFNYTDFSDIDIHLIVDYEGSVCPDMADNLFTAKKTLWNQSHAIEIKGYGVELYVEDTKNPVTANGVYSLLSGEWVKEPKRGRPSWDDNALLAKIEACAEEIDTLLATEEPAQSEIEALFDRIKRMRRAGLARAGEFSVENLAYKGLRNLGLLDRLWHARIEAEDRSLSLEGQAPQK